MQDYKEEIIAEGTKTLENFLLLLKEDYLLHKNVKERRNFDKDKIDKIKTTRKKFESEDALLNSEISISADEYIEYRTEIDKQIKISKSQYLASNSYFIYLFSIFDQFILKIARISIKNEPEIKTKYKKYCTQFYERNQIKELLDILTFEDELIDYLPKLSKLTSPIKTVSKIFEINFEHERYRKHYFKFIEMKERRNLLVHRGGIGDELYIETIRSYLSKFPQKERNAFMKTLENNKDKNLRIDPIYFRRTIITLYFMVAVIVSNSFSRVNNYNNKLILFTEPFNDLLNFSIKNKYIDNLIQTPLELYSLYLSIYLEDDLTKMEDVDKVNWILSHEGNKEMIEYRIKNFKDSPLAKFEIKLKTKIFPSMDKFNIKLLNSIEDKLIKEIIDSYLEKNFSKYIESILLYSKKMEMPLKDIESNWYMHRKLSEIEEFRKIYASYKKDLKPQKIKVKIIKNSEKK